MFKMRVTSDKMKLLIKKFPLGKKVSEPALPNGFFLFKNNGK